MASRSVALATPVAPRSLPGARPALWTLAAGVLVAWPFLLPSFTHFYGVLSICFALVGLSLTVLAGWTGQISLGHAAFLGLGVYSTETMLRWGLPLPTVLLAAALLGAVVSLALGIPSLRLRGVYLSIVTLAFGVMAENFLFPLDFLAGGEGAKVIERPDVLGFSIVTDRGLYFLALVVGAAALLVVWNLRRSSVGRTLFAIRDSEDAAQALGIRIAPYKIGAFAFSAALACVAGVLYGLLFNATPGPSQFGVLQSLFFLSIPVIGGLEWIAGAIVGGILLAVAQPTVNAFGVRLLLASGTLLVVILLARSGGVVGMAYTAAASVRRHLAEFSRDDPAPPAEPPAPARLRVRAVGVRHGRLRARLVRTEQD